MTSEDQFDCPYCNAELSTGVLSCRCCGRDLTPVLPVLRRLRSLERRLDDLEARPTLRPPGVQVVDDEATHLSDPPTTFRRRPVFLLAGLLALLLSHAAVVLWLDLPLIVLRALSLAIPFFMGLAYVPSRTRSSWIDAAVAGIFAIVAVAAMNASVAYVDDAPIMPQGPAAWRETVVYALSIGAAAYTGMLVRLIGNSLSARGLSSVPGLRDAVLAANKNVPMDTLKAIEMMILLGGTIFTALTSLVAGLMGVVR